MAFLNNFDANSVEPQTFEPVPAGYYNAIITDSEWGQTRSGNGRFLKLTFQIYEGDYKGRLVFTRLNLENPNTQTVEIARSQLSSICRAVGVMRPNDSCELHNLPLTIKISLRRNEANDEVYNEIKDFKPRNSQNPQQTAPVADSTAPSAPWKR